MIDAVWLLGSRAMLDYTKAATTWLLTRKRHDEMEQTIETATTENNPITTARKISYAIAGIVFALFICPLLVIGVYSILTSLMSL